MIRMIAHRVEDRLAHIVSGAIQHDRVGALLYNEIVDASCVPGGIDIVAMIAQREREQFGNFRSVVNQQDAMQSISYFLAGPEPGNRALLLALGSISITQIRPPAV